MKIINNYPRLNKVVNKFIKFRKIVLLVFLISIISCVIINLSVGGKHWMFYVIGGEILIYYAVLNKPLIDNTFVKRFTVIVTISCFYLYLIDLVEHTAWSYYVITIIIFSLLIVQMLLFFSAYRYQRRKFIPMFWSSIISVILCILALTNVLEMNWPMIVMGSLGITIILIMFTFFRKEIVNDLKKYFNVN